MPVLLTIYIFFMQNVFLVGQTFLSVSFAETELCLSPVDRQECSSYSPFTIYFMQNVFLVGQTFLSVGFCRNGTVLFTYGQAGMPVLLTIYHLLHAECLQSKGNTSDNPRRLYTPR